MREAGDGGSPGSTGVPSGRTIDTSPPTPMPARAKRLRGQPAWVCGDRQSQTCPRNGRESGYGVRCKPRSHGGRRGPVVGRQRRCRGRQSQHCRRHPVRRRRRWSRALARSSGRAGEASVAGGASATSSATPRTTPATPRLASTTGSVSGRTEPSAALPAGTDVGTLRREAAACRACHLWERATRTVFGEGSRPRPRHARRRAAR